jgi:hypothetical protein
MDNGDKSDERTRSNRFQRNVKITRHARQRMSERGISHDLLSDLIETGSAKYKDEHRLWLSKSYSDRDDNLICAAVVLEEEVIVKTVMHRWQLVE